jgi:tight adherence protein B
VLTAPALPVHTPGLGRFVAWAGARRRVDTALAVDTVAGVAERLAALLSAGVAPGAAWRNVVSDARAGDASVVAAAADAASDGEPVAPVLEAARQAHADASPAWSVLAAAWSVADAAGAPLASCLSMLASALRDEAQLRREARAALAGPAASARLVTALPLIAVAFGALLGFDTLGVLLGNPLGLACLALGSLFLWAGARWSRWLVARAATAQPAAGLELELLAVALSSGASLERAQRIVASALHDHLPGLASSGAAEPVVEVAERAGAPVAELLRSEAARLRGAARAEGATRAASLGVRLMVPLGCCVLPAFVLVGVAPLMISVVTGTLGGAS